MVTEQIQLKKGVLELCVLVVLSKRPHYGYELVEAVSESIEMSEGTIYPLLKRLRDDGLVLSYLQESSSGAARKYYQLTPKGVEVKNFLVAQWEEFAQKIHKLLNKYD